MAIVYRLSSIWRPAATRERQLPVLQVLQVQVQVLVMPIMVPPMPEPHVLNQVCIADAMGFVLQGALALTT